LRQICIHRKKNFCCLLWKSFPYESQRYIYCTLSLIIFHIISLSYLFSQLRISVNYVFGRKHIFTILIGWLDSSFKNVIYRYSHFLFFLFIIVYELFYLLYMNYLGLLSQHSKKNIHCLPPFSLFISCYFSHWCFLYCVLKY
jgi:hypothetical protein